MGPYSTPPAGSPRPGPGGQPHPAHPNRPHPHYPAGPPPPGPPPPSQPSPSSEPPPSNGKAGRNLPLAIIAGLVLGAIVLGSLLVYRQVFLAVIALAIGLGIWECGQAAAKAGIRIPTWPLIACGLGMGGLTWFGGPTMLMLGMGITIMVLVVWRLADGATGYHVDVPAAVTVAAFVPFLGGFAVLMLQPADGHLRIIAALAVVVLSDTGGYIAGVLFGRHPMAPTISPKKSWEGLGGSVLACAIGGAVLLYLMFEAPIWWGVLFGASLAVAATVGDLTESFIKRDLGVKDMSKLVPGHGGLMDRLDSILLALPVAYAWLSYLAG